MVKFGSNVLLLIFLKVVLISGTIHLATFPSTTSQLQALDPMAQTNSSKAINYTKNPLPSVENRQLLQNVPQNVNSFDQHIVAGSNEYDIQSWELQKDNFPNIEQSDDVKIAVTNDDQIRMMITIEDYASIPQILEELDADYVDYHPSSQILVANMRVSKGSLVLDPHDNQVSDTTILGVEKIEPDYVIKTNFVPNDPLWSQQWGPQKIGLSTAWNSQLGNRSVKVAVMDTGIDYTHPDLSDNYLSIGYDYVNGDSDPMDDQYHGTHVAGTIAASIDNSEGIAGVANISIFAQKILDFQGSGFYSWAIDAIYNATDLGADILSNSWGGSAYSSNLEDAVNYAVDNGVLFIAAAGNDASIAPHYPAAFENAISVSATNSTDGLASFSNFGSTIDIAAPGVDIVSTFPQAHPNGPYYSISGTSMATPHVSGLAALYWSQFRSYSASQIENLLYTSAVDLGDPGYDSLFGWGRINVSDAMSGLDNYDVSVKVQQTDHRTSDDTLIYTVTVENAGLLSISSFDLLVYVDGFLHSQEPVGTVQSGTDTSLSFGITNQFERINITAAVAALPGEIFVSNNMDTIILKSFQLTSLDDGQEVGGGLIYMDPKLLDPTNLATFNLILNNEMIADAPGKGVMDERLFFPVFNNGTNHLTLQAKWVDGTFYNYDISIVSFDVIPLLDVKLGDQIVWTWDNLDGSFQDQQYTFDHWVSPFEINITLYAKEYDDLGLIWEDTYWAVINVVNGYYVSTNFGWDGNRFSFLTGTNSIFSEISIESVFPGFYTWNSVHDFVDRKTNVDDFDLIVGNIDGFATEINKPTGILNSYGNGFLNATTILPEIKDIGVTIEVPQDDIQPNSDVSISGEIKNKGDFVGRNIDIEAYVDGVQQEQRTVDLLFTGETELVELFIIISPELLGGTVNITITADLVDDIPTNNKHSYFIDLVDTTPPELLQSSSDFSYSSGETGNIVEWLFSDKFAANYSISIDGNEVETGQWASNQVISINLDHLEVGEHDIAITVNDWLQQSTSDTVMVTVLATSTAIEDTTDDITTSTNKDQDATSKASDPSLDLPGLGFELSVISLVCVPILRRFQNKR